MIGTWHYCNFSIVSIIIILVFKRRIEMYNILIGDWFSIGFRLAHSFAPANRRLCSISDLLYLWIMIRDRMKNIMQKVSHFPDYFRLINRKFVIIIIRIITCEMKMRHILFLSVRYFFLAIEAHKEISNSLFFFLFEVCIFFRDFIRSFWFKFKSIISRSALIFNFTLILIVIYCKKKTENCKPEFTNILPNCWS